MEFSNSANELQNTIDSAFECLGLNQRSKAIALLFSVSTHAGFDKAFRDASRKLAQAKPPLTSMKWWQQQKAFARGLQKFAKPFPLLWSLIFEVRSTRPDAPLRTMRGVLRHVGGPGLKPGPEAFDEAFKAFASLSEQWRAENLGLLTAALSRAELDKNFGPQIRSALHAISPAWSATAWIAFVTSGSHLVSPDDCANTVKALGQRTTKERDALVILINTLSTLQGAHLFSDAQITAIFRHLANNREWAHVASFLRTRWAPLVCNSLFAPDQARPWGALDEWGFVDLLVAELLRSGQVAAVSEIVAYCVRLGQDDLALVVRLTIALGDGRHAVEADWDLLIGWLHGLDEESAVTTCTSFVSALYKTGLFTEERKQRLVLLTRSWPDEQKARYLSNLIAGCCGDVGPNLWKIALDLAKEHGFQFIGMRHRFVDLALTQREGWKPAPDEIAVELLQFLTQSLAGKANTQWPDVICEKSRPSAATFKWLLGPGAPVLADLCKRIRPARLLMAQAARIAPEFLLALPPLDKLASPNDLLGIIFAVAETLAQQAPLNAHLADLLRRWTDLLPPPLGPLASLAMEVIKQRSASGQLPQPLTLARPGSPFKTLGRPVQQCLELSANPDGWRSVQWQAAYQAALANALIRPSLQLDTLETLFVYRRELRTPAPKVNWNIVFNGDAQESIRLCTVPAAGECLTAWCTAIYRVVAALCDCGAKDAGRHKTIVDALAPHLKPLLQALVGEQPKLVAIDAVSLPQLLAAALPSRPTLDSLDGELLRRITDRFNQQAPALKKDIAGHVAALLQVGQAQLQGDDAQRIGNLQAAHKALVALITGADFALQREVFGFYTLEIMSKDLPDCLLLGHAIEPRLAPDGSRACAMLDRLAGPWVLVAVRDAAGVLVAMAWCVLCTIPSSKLLVPVCDLISVKPDLDNKSTVINNETVIVPFSKAVATQLVAGLPWVAGRLGLQRAFAVWCPTGPTAQWEAPSHAPADPPGLAVLGPLALTTDFIGVAFDGSFHIYEVDPLPPGDGH